MNTWRNIIKTEHKSKEHYRFYKDRYPKSKLSYKIIRAVTCDFNKMMIQAIMNTSLDMDIGCLGSLGIRKSKMWYTDKNKIQPDWNLWKKTGKYVKMYNDQTDGFVYRWVWNKGNHKIKNGSLYSFRCSRINNRALAKSIKEGKNDYFELEWASIRKQRNKNK